MYNNVKTCNPGLLSRPYLARWKISQCSHRRTLFTVLHIRVVTCVFQCLSAAFVRINSALFIPRHSSIILTANIHKCEFIIVKKTRTDGDANMSAELRKHSCDRVFK